MYGFIISHNGSVLLEKKKKKRELIFSLGILCSVFFSLSLKGMIRPRLGGRPEILLAANLSLICNPLLANSPTCCMRLPPTGWLTGEPTVWLLLYRLNGRVSARLIDCLAERERWEGVTDRDTAVFCTARRRLTLIELLLLGSWQPIKTSEWCAK